MKKVLFISILAFACICFFACNGKVKNNASNNTVTTTVANNGPAAGTYNASGTVKFTAGGLDYSCAVSKVIVAQTVLTIQTSSADIHNTGSITISCYTATSAVTTGTYKSSTPSAVSSVTWVDKKVTPYNATSATAGSDCTVIITNYTSSSVKGTFTATAMPVLGKSGLTITNGVIDCTISSR